MPFSAPVLTYRAKGLASNIQSKVLKVYNTLININITAISAPEMTYTPHQMTREIVKELDPKLFITFDGYDELVKQQGFASTWRKFKAAQEQTKQE